MNKTLITAIYLMAIPIYTSAQNEPYKNPNISPQERAADLCSRLTLEEKSLLMMDSSPAIPRLDIPQFQWWSEALHGVARNSYATVFPQTIGMAASFDDKLLYQIFNATSDEARAKNTAQRKKGKILRYQGLSLWTPNINIFRDPRWGRGQETYGEDPYLTTRMGLAVVKGLQGDSQTKYTKLYACAKHFAVHSGPEWSRHRFNAENISPRDLWETYLPAFKSLVKDGGVKEVMCAYNRYEGDPCCGSNRLLSQILREEWGFKGIVVSDCGAISDFWKKGDHETEPDAKSASAKAVVSGTDVECGNNYKSLPEAVKDGKISESQIDVSVKRLLAARFELGDFDPDSLVEWTTIPESVIACQAHKDLALQMARESMTLLMNKNNILPLSKTGHKIMVMGPNADNATMQWGNYNGTPTNTVTILDGIKNKTSNVTYTMGCEHCINTATESRFNEIISTNGKKGFTATYWNNLKMEGEPATTQQVSEPFNFDIGGNTVFASGVSLNNFTAKYKGTFIPTKNENVSFNITGDDGYIVVVNNDTIIKSWGNRLTTKEADLKVEMGKKYDIEIDYKQTEGDATLKFDLVHIKNQTAEESAHLAKDADVVIFVGGLSPRLEGEEMHVNIPGFKDGDRTDIQLPKAQRDVITALHRLGKKIIFVNCSGSAVALGPEVANCDAILQAWYPGEQGGTAVADVLFGDYNPQGKLPITFYKDTTQLPSFEDYNMKGRTYRYFKGKPLFPFGYGLSYTTFGIDKSNLVGKIGKDAKLNLSVTNTGKKDGTYVAQLYVRSLDDKDSPIITLRDFERTEIKAGESKTVVFNITPKTFERFDPNTNTVRIVPGRYELRYGSSSELESQKSMTITLE